MITNIDVSKDFYRLSKLMYKKIKCISIQRGARGDLFYNIKKERKNVFIPFYFHLGEYEKKIFRLKKFPANIINPVALLVYCMLITLLIKKN